MTSCENICRICSSSADYEIFAKIPVYLHGSTNEFLNWQKPINLLLEETTGLKNSPHDGLPRHICAPCISYLKHAVNFREQYIKNAISLKLATFHQQKSVNIDDTNKLDKEAVLFTAQDLPYVERPAHDLLLKNSVKPSITDKVHKQLLNQTVPTVGSNEQGIQYLNLLFDKERNAGLRQKEGNTVGIELPSTSAGSRHGNVRCEDEYYHYPAASSSDENDENILSRQDKNCYNYSETNFEDDDPMDAMNIRDIKVNIPEPKWKERKCPACYKLFMLEDTYKSHICNCVEHQFLAFVTEMNKLLSIRQQKMLSPHEFIRRMIFTLHKTCTWLQEHSIDDVLTEKLNQVKVAYNGNNDKTTEVLESWVMSPPRETPAEPIKWLTDLDSDEFDAFFFASGSATPITAENNVLYIIERSESRNSQSTPQVKKPIPIRGNNTSSQVRSPQTIKNNTKQNNASERATFLKKLQRAAVTEPAHHLRTTPTSSVNAPMAFSARCSQCNLMFDSVSKLEIHNIKHHNTPNTQAAVDTDSRVTDDARRQIIALFEDDI